MVCSFTSLTSASCFAKNIRSKTRILLSCVDSESAEMIHKQPREERIASSFLNDAAVDHAM